MKAETDEREGKLKAMYTFKNSKNPLGTNWPENT